MASDIFSKIGEIKGESLSRQLDHQLIKLGTDFDRVGDAFIGLIADALKVSEHKHVANIKYTDALIKHDVDTIGADFVKLGDGFLKLDEAQHKFDDAFLKSSDLFINPDKSIKFGADFNQLDTDLKLTGADSSSLGFDIIKLTDAQTLSKDFLKLSDGLNSVGDDFIKLGLDYKFAEINATALKLSESDASRINEALHKLGSDTGGTQETGGLAADFHKLSVDFQQIASDFTPSEGNLTLKIDQVALSNQFADHVHKLDTDLHALDGDLKLVGADYIKLTDAFHDALHGGGHSPPVLTDTLGQVLALAQHFSLL